jgi:signal transduction histidine kinase
MQNDVAVGAMILIVERDRTVRELRSFFLNRAGFAVEFADDGQSALDRVRRDPPVLLITEILIPNIDALTAHGDTARLRQVLVNRIGKAVKFTPRDGKITVTTTAVADGEWGVIRVTDSGPGIAAAEREAIFQPYYRSEGTAALPGIGLGLAISHALVVQMGGTLGVESEEGAGSSFTLRLRSRDATSHSPHAARAKSPALLSRPQELP